MGHNFSKNKSKESFIEEGRALLSSVDDNDYIGIKDNSNSKTAPEFTTYQNAYLRLAWLITLLAMVGQGLMAGLLADLFIKKYLSESIPVRLLLVIAVSYFAGEGKRALVWRVSRKGHEELSKISAEDIKAFFDPHNWTAQGIFTGTLNASFTLVASAAFAGLGYEATGFTAKLVKDYKLVIAHKHVSTTVASILDSKVTKTILALSPFLSNLPGFRGIHIGAAYDVLKFIRYCNRDAETTRMLDVIERHLEGHKLRHKKDFEKLYASNYQDIDNYYNKWKTNFNQSQLLDTLSHIDITPAPALKNWQSAAINIAGLATVTATIIGFYNFRTIAPDAVKTFLDIIYLGFLVENPIVRNIIGVMDLTSMSALALICTFGLGSWLAKTLIRSMQYGHNAELVPMSMPRFITTTSIALIGLVLGSFPVLFQAIVMAHEPAWQAGFASDGSINTESLALFAVIVTLSYFFFKKNSEVELYASNLNNEFLEVEKNLSNLPKEKILEYYNNINACKASNEVEAQPSNEDNHNNNSTTTKEKETSYCCTLFRPKKTIQETPQEESDNTHKKDYRCVII